MAARAMRAWFVVVLVVLGIAAVSVYLGMRFLQTPIAALDGERTIEVEPGVAYSNFLKQLDSDLQLGYPLVLRVLTRIRYPDFVLKAGEYRVPAGTSVTGLLDILDRGVTVQHRVQFTEGETLLTVLATLNEHPILKESGSVALDEVATLLAIEGNNAEGWLFPDTYFISRGDTVTEVLYRAHQKMRDTLERSWAARDVALPYNSAYEALIMASLVEKETGVISEREQIAGVFVRRLQRGMRLQTDPSVIYGMGAAYKGNLRRVDLRNDTPYNTYTRYGLPPTPIAMPGEGAINACLNPAAGTALYFVAKGDGTHHFSDTLEEHNAAVQRYQVLKRRADYRSAPPVKTAPSG